MMIDRSKSPCPVIKEFSQKCTVRDRHSRNIDKAFHTRGEKFEKCVICLHDVDSMSRQGDSRGRKPDRRELLCTNPN